MALVATLVAPAAAGAATATAPFLIPGGRQPQVSTKVMVSFDQPSGWSRAAGTVDPGGSLHRVALLAGAGRCTLRLQTSGRPNRLPPVAKSGTVRLWPGPFGPTFPIAREGRESGVKWYVGGVGDHQRAAAAFRTPAALAVVDRPWTVVQMRLSHVLRRFGPGNTVKAPTAAQTRACRAFLQRAQAVLVPAVRSVRLVPRDPAA